MVWLSHRSTLKAKKVEMVRARFSDYFSSKNEYDDRILPEVRKYESTFVLRTFVPPKVQLLRMKIDKCSIQLRATCTRTVEYPIRRFWNHSFIFIVYVYSLYARVQLYTYCRECEWLISASKKYRCTTLTTGSHTHGYRKAQYRKIWKASPLASRKVTWFPSMSSRHARLAARGCAFQQPILLGFLHAFCYLTCVPQRLGKRVKMIRELVRDVVGNAPYEKRLMELLKVGRDKRALKLAKRKVSANVRVSRQAPPCTRSFVSLLWSF